MMYRYIYFMVGDIEYGTRTPQFIFPVAAPLHFSTPLYLYVLINCGDRASRTVWHGHSIRMHNLEFPDPHMSLESALNAGKADQRD